MMDAHDLDFETIKPIDLDRETLEPGSTATPSSKLIWAVAAGDIATGDIATVEALYEERVTDDIEWGLMPYNKVLKGKAEVIPMLRAGSADQKKPVVITNAVADDWGVFEYWNIGTFSEEVMRFGNEQKWPWPRDPTTFLGQKYRVAQCFVYHITPEGKIDFMRQYLDTGSVWAQFK
jgi:hypothetical protein